MLVGLTYPTWRPFHQHLYNLPPTLSLQHQLNVESTAILEEGQATKQNDPVVCAGTEGSESLWTLSTAPGTYSNDGNTREPFLNETFQISEDQMWPAGNVVQ